MIYFLIAQACLAIALATAGRAIKKSAKVCVRLAVNLKPPVNSVWKKICPLNLEPGNYIYSQILNMLYLRLRCDVRRY